jgi:hypothetical protein
MKEFAIGALTVTVGIVVGMVVYDQVKKLLA